MCLYLLKAQEEAEARDLGIGLLRTSDELSEGEKGNGLNLIMFRSIQNKKLIEK